MHIVLIAPSRSGHSWTANMLSSWLPNDKIHKFEGIPPCLYKARVNINVWQGNKPKKDQPVIPILQVRDFLNYSASLIKHLINNHNARESRFAGLTDVWMDVTREAFNDTQFIENKHIIYYDQFVENEAYRRAICRLLEGEYNEEKIDKVPMNGPGSSFDKYQFNERGSQMKVLDRWKWFLTKEGETYIPFLRARKNIVEYYLKHFELKPEQSELAIYILK